MSWDEALDCWGAQLRAAGRAETTIRLRRYHLQRLARAAGGGPWAVTPETLTRWLGTRPWSRETLRSVRASVVRFYAWGEARGHVAHSPAAGLETVRPADPDPHPVDETTLVAVLATTDARTRLMVQLGAYLGMRRGEVARVRGSDLAQTPYGWVIRVRGKGDRVRVLPVPDDLARAVRVHTMSHGQPYVFPSPSGGHLTPEHVGRVVSRAMPAGVTMHALRHRFATAAYAVDADLLAVMRLLGHASPETTRRYVLRPDDDLRRLVLAVAQ